MDECSDRWLSIYIATRTHIHSHMLSFIHPNYNTRIRPHLNVCVLVEARLPRVWCARGCWLSFASPTARAGEPEGVDLASLLACGRFVRASSSCSAVFHTVGTDDTHRRHALHARDACSRLLGSRKEHRRATAPAGSSTRWRLESAAGVRRHRLRGICGTCGGGGVGVGSG
jgi:hypothetical protein